MSLKRQLFLLGLLTLVLPWLALRYMVQVDETLQQIRLASLQELAENARKLLVQDRYLIDRLALRNNAVPATFAAPAVADMLVDGYLTEWPFFNGSCTMGACAAQKFVNLPKGVEARWHNAMAYDEREGLYLALHISGITPVLFQPQGANDAVILRFENESFKLQVARGGGGFVQRYTGLQPRWQRDYSSVGLWQINTLDNAISIEWRLPARVKDEAFTLEFVSADLGYSLFATDQNHPVHWAFYEPDLAPSIAKILGPEQNAVVYDARGYPLVDVGGLELGYGLPALELARPWLSRLYVAFLNRSAKGYTKPSIPLLPHESGADKQWLFNRIAPVARVIVPLLVDGEVIGWFVMDRQESRFDTLLAGIYGQFLLLCVAFAGLVVLVLVCFASLHSWRIRRLAASAEKAVDKQGGLDLEAIATSFKVSRSSDEIGQLSRSLSVLLARLGSQQEYLRNLAGKLSHELRTPIAVIQSSLDNLQASGLNDEQAVYAKRADDGAKRLSRTLNAMSAANALEQSIKGVELERFNIRALLGDIAGAYQGAYAPQSISFSLVDFAGDDEPLWPFLGAPELIVQMFDKLIENACQFAVAQSVVEFDCARVSDAEHGFDGIRVRISNIGPSLPKGMESQVFDSMVSVRAGRHSGGGAIKPLHLGLGLYVARLICAFHQGSIRAFCDSYRPNGQNGLVGGNELLAKVTFEVVLPIQ